jgi:tetratricopeptide (TPR) repeat protein
LSIPLVIGVSAGLSICGLTIIFMPTSLIQQAQAQFSKAVQSSSPPSSTSGGDNFGTSIGPLQPSSNVPRREVFTLLDKDNALRNEGDHTGAIQYYDKVLAIDPNNKDVLHEKSNALAWLGHGVFDKENYSQAIQYYDKALALPDIVYGNTTSHKVVLYDKDVILSHLNRVNNSTKW